MLVTDYARQNKTYRYGDKNLSKVKNKGIKAGQRHCSRSANNNSGQVFIQNETRRHNVLQYKNLIKVNDKTSKQGMKTAKRYHQKDTGTMLRRYSGGFIANPKHGPHTAPVLHFSILNRQMLEILTLCKGSKICPMLLE